MYAFKTPFLPTLSLSMCVTVCVSVCLSFMLLLEQYQQSVLDVFAKCQTPPGLR